eukprot:gene46414-62872_t
MGFGLRWGQMGLFETYRVAGGEAGMKHFMAQFGPCLTWPWTKLMDVQAVLQKAAEAADSGSRRFCMGAAWRNPKDRDMPAILQIVQGVRAMGMETCMTLGMLTPKQADMLADAGLDYYNHNIDTSPERYNEIITTRSARVSPSPTMPPLQTLIPARRTSAKVSSRSSIVRVVMISLYRSGL